MATVPKAEFDKQKALDIVLRLYEATGTRFTGDDTAVTSLIHGARQVATYLGEDA